MTGDDMSVAAKEMRLASIPNHRRAAAKASARLMRMLPGLTRVAAGTSNRDEDCVLDSLAALQEVVEVLEDGLASIRCTGNYKAGHTNSAVRS